MRYTEIDILEAPGRAGAFAARFWAAKGTIRR
jgi:hypothetical protein